MDNWAGLILAAGKGSRMKSNTPKVLHEILGQSLIQFPITALRETGINDIELRIIDSFGREKWVNLAA